MLFRINTNAWYTKISFKCHTGIIQTESSVFRLPYYIFKKMLYLHSEMKNTLKYLGVWKNYLKISFMHEWNEITIVSKCSEFDFDEDLHLSFYKFSAFLFISLSIWRVENDRKENKYPRRFYVNRLWEDRDFRAQTSFVLPWKKKKIEESRNSYISLYGLVRYLQ